MDAVFPAVFGGQESRIGVVHEVSRGQEGRIEIQSDADGGMGKFFSGAERGIGNLSVEPLGDDVGFFDGGAGEYDGEFIAAIAGGDIGFTDALGDLFGDMEEGGVAGEVTEVIVDDFEVVHVNHQERKGRAVASGAEDFTVEDGEEAAVVEESGQAVGLGLFLNGLVEFDVIHGRADDFAEEPHGGQVDFGIESGAIDFVGEVENTGNASASGQRGDDAASRVVFVAEGAGNVLFFGVDPLTEVFDDEDVFEPDGRSHGGVGIIPERDRVIDGVGVIVVEKAECFTVRVVGVEGRETGVDEMGNLLDADGGDFFHVEAVDLAGQIGDLVDFPDNGLLDVEIGVHLAELGLEDGNLPGEIMIFFVKFMEGVILDGRIF